MRKYFGWNEPGINEDAMKYGTIVSIVGYLIAYGFGIWYFII